MRTAIELTVLYVCCILAGLLIGWLPAQADEVKQCSIGYEQVERKLSDGRTYITCRPAKKQCHWEGNVKRCMRVTPKKPKRVKELPKPFKKQQKKHSVEELLDQLARK